ncbi:MAG: hypothetical protein RMK29_15965 [Myxococcales bacterium]|nr:type III-B CRISPR module RAMP protein Cmr1 [Myxococcota bacterium]MDW8283213.1 hypothetical protein [Myxococcales bacterium]
MPVFIHVTLRTETPLFLGGARPQAEWRLSALKGALRFWYRALDPQHAGRPGRAPSREERCFGGTRQGSGQAAFLLRGDFLTLPGQRVRWEAFPVGRFHEGEGRQRRNGLAYLGFPFSMRGNEDRDAIPAGTKLPLQLVVLRTPEDPLLRHALLGSLWLLGTLGSLGMRSRRGFGALSLMSWRIQGAGPHARAWEQDLAALPLLHEAATPEAWMARLREGLAVLQTSWFAPFQEKDEVARQRPQPHLGPRWNAVILRRGFPAEQWPAALNLAGRALQDFRVRRAPDYQDVKDHLSRLRRLVRAPQRASFGLPLTFRYGSLPPEQNQLELVPAGNLLERRWSQARTSSLDRHASPLLLKLVPVGKGLHPLFVRLDGAVPGQFPPAMVRREGQPLQPGVDLLTPFLDEMAHKGVRL